MVSELGKLVVKSKDGFGLNPYSIGRWSVSDSGKSMFSYDFVLILILLEDGQ